VSAPPTLATLAAQLNALSGDEAASLVTDALYRQNRRVAVVFLGHAEAARAERIAAEAERDARYPRCACGQPAKILRSAICDEYTVVPGTGRRYVRGSEHHPLRGGIVATHRGSGEPVPASSAPVYVKDGDTYREVDLNKVAWVTCGDDACGWTLLLDGDARVVDWD
jgi:hypothetical protein